MRSRRFFRLRRIVLILEPARSGERMRLWQLEHDFRVSALQPVKKDAEREARLRGKH